MATVAHTTTAHTKTAPGLPAQVAGILRSEFCKFRTVRSTMWALFSAVLSNIAFAGLAAIFIPGQLSAQDQLSTDGIRLSLAGIHLSQIAFGVLGAMLITSEYATGLIRVTFTAIPQRRLVFAAKAAVFTTTALIVGVGSCFAAYVTFETLLSGDTLRAAIGDPGVLRAIIGGGLYLVVLGLFGFGLGAIIRSSAGSIAALFSLLFVPSILISLLPHTWQNTIGPYLPMEAGSQIFVAVQHDPNSLGAWSGFGVFSLYAATALAIGFVIIGRRDT